MTFTKHLIVETSQQQELILSFTLHFLYFFFYLYFLFLYARHTKEHRHYFL